ncbi:MAG TPA: peptidoglycan-binding protein, partial [Deltaproteobacteria bacterium]|nr:peptidoglycan-binding protein [Deltaproteobacteria bacterium]
WAVNTGPVRAIRHLQGCLSVAQDGIIGPVTRERMAVAGDDVLDCFLKRREIFYKSQPKKKKDVFLKGWMNRLEALGEYLSEL